MSNAIYFPCPGCSKRIKAPCQIRGQTRACPGCGHRFVVEYTPPEDEGPVLVPNDHAERHAALMFRS